MPSRTRGTLQAWSLFAWLAFALFAMTALLWVLSPDVEGVRSVIRATARSSLLLFFLAATASAVYRLWPGDWTRWQRQNRRYLGLAFALSHGLHLVAIVAFARMDPLTFQTQTNPLNQAFGGVAYLFIFAMAATSFDRTARWLGPVAWKRLHTIGIHYVGFIFLASYARRALENPQYWLGAAVILAALGLRLLARRPQSRTVAG